MGDKLNRLKMWEQWEVEFFGFPIDLAQAVIL